MVLALIYNEHDPVQVRLHRAAIRSIEDINESVENLFPKPPKIQIFNVTYTRDLKIDDSLLQDKFDELVLVHGVRTFMGLSSDSQEVQTLMAKGRFIL